MTHNDQCDEQQLLRSEDKMDPACDLELQYFVF
jgi:hypothetical protein|eukprot:COSAG01_NODE_6239_length_3775_cov_1.900979_1_plen_33_part_00